jgi:EAL domain-containing protein (putative c-di-GMP-specific phosphodiesterase class I)
MSTTDHVAPEVLAGELGEAIETSQLRLYYQPIVSLTDRVAHEVEALLRWPRNGDGRILAADDFIGVAEEFDLLTALEHWSIEAAFEQLSRWRRANDVDVSLNISDAHVYQSDLCEEIGGAAERFGVDPRRLSLEISETALLETEQGRLEKLNAISGLGVGLIVDDYSGAVPKAELAQVPTRALKISRRVIAGIPDGPRHTETVAGAIRIAAELGVTVIANGIESPGQLAALRDMGCQFGQGFLFSIPMPAEVLNERAAR